MRIPVGERLQNAVLEIRPGMRGDDRAARLGACPLRAPNKKTRRE
jgi:hypothetical protein